MSGKRFHIDRAPEMLGQEIGVSDWLVIDQEKIDGFAAITGDRDWLHNNPARAESGPYGTTIAQGFLTLSHLTQMAENAGVAPEGVNYPLNYGFNHVRFLQPVRTGARIRDRVTLTGVKEKVPGQVLLTTTHTVEIKGEAKPALVAEWLGLFVKDQP